MYCIQAGGSHTYDMSTTAVIGISAGKRLLSSAFCYSDFNEHKLSHIGEVGYSHHAVSSTKNSISAKKSAQPSSSSHYGPSSFSSIRDSYSVNAVKEHLGPTSADPSVVDLWHQKFKDLEDEKVNIDPEDYSLEALLLLQKSMLEKQWNLSTEQAKAAETAEKEKEKEKDKMKKKSPNLNHITCSGVSARRRRLENRMKFSRRSSNKNQLRSNISTYQTPSRLKGYAKMSDELLTHAEVIQLSKKIKTGAFLEERRSRLKERLGCEPSEGQIASSLRISRLELQSKLMECNLAREKLAMSNVRLVMSVAHRYDHTGAEMSDLVQAGLIGLLRGIEKFDSSKGFKISTYVYWWIRQGVTRAVVENSGTITLPTYLHERLSLIRNARTRLEDNGITPTIGRIAEYLHMSEKKVRNATEAVTKVISLDKEVFPSLNGLPGETLHSYVADDHVENIPWLAVEEWALKDEVHKLMNTTLRERERDIIRLYYGFDSECLSWEDISKRIGLSRERVRQLGLVAMEKLKHVARKRRLDAMLIKR